MHTLGTTFTPGPSDVILGRGKLPHAHPGNIKFNEMIKTKYLTRYSKADTRTLKSQIVAEIVSLVRRNSPDGGFVKCTNGSWYEVGDHLAREKVSQSLRDALDFKYESAAKTKRKKRAKRKIPGPSAVTLRHHRDARPPLSPGMNCGPATVVSPGLSGKLLRPTPPIAGMVGQAAASGMALTELYMRRRRPCGLSAPHIAPPPPPPLYNPMARDGSSLASRVGSDKSLPQRPPPRGGTTILSPSSAPRATTPEDFMAACDQLPDSALLKTDPKVLNAYCTIMAFIKGKGDPEDVMLTDLMLRRTLFRE